MYYIIKEVTCLQNGKLVTFRELHNKEYPNFSEAFDGLDELQNDLDNYNVNRFPHKFIATPKDQNTKKYFPELSAKIVKTL